MNRDQRKAATAAYKERKTEGGIYAVLCRPLDQRWIGRAMDLDKIQNRLWFTLRRGTSPHASLQAAWNTHGPDAFTFDVIERLEDEELAYLKDRVLAERLVHWCAAYGAEAI